MPAILRPEESTRKGKEAVPAQGAHSKCGETRPKLGGDPGGGGKGGWPYVAQTRPAEQDWWQRSMQAGQAGMRPRAGEGVGRELPAGRECFLLLSAPHSRVALGKCAHSRLPDLDGASWPRGAGLAPPGRSFA